MEARDLVQAKRLNARVPKFFPVEVAVQNAQVAVEKLFAAEVDERDTAKREEVLWQRKMLRK